MNKTDFHLTDLRDIGAKGQVRVFLTRNIGENSLRFREPDNDTNEDDEKKRVERFWELRGSAVFSNVIRALPNQIGPFMKMQQMIPSGKESKDDEDARLIDLEVGYDFGIFNQMMLREEFMPMYVWSGTRVPEFKHLKERFEDPLKEKGVELSPYLDELIKELQKLWLEWTELKKSWSESTELKNEIENGSKLVIRAVVLQSKIDTPKGQAKKKVQKKEVAFYNKTNRKEKPAYKWSATRTGFMNLMLSRYGLFQSIFRRSMYGKNTMIEDLLIVKSLQERLAIRVRVDNITLAEALEKKLNSSDIPENIKLQLYPLLFLSVRWELMRELIDQWADGVREIHKANQWDVHSTATSEEEREKESILMDKCKEIITHIVATDDRRTGRDRTVIKDHYPQPGYNGRMTFTVFDINHFTDAVGCKEDDEEPQEIQNTQDKQQYKQLIKKAIGSLFESSIITSGNRRYLSTMSKGMLKKIFAGNVATWPQEYCLLSRDTAVFYYRSRHPMQKDQSNRVRESRDLVRYGNYNYYEYWSSIRRAFRYLIELRLAAKIIERETTKILEDIQWDIVSLPTGTKRSSKRTQYLERMSACAHMISRIKYTSSSSTIGSVDFAMMKYVRLRKILAIPKMLKRAQANIEMIKSII